MAKSQVLISRKTFLLEEMKALESEIQDEASAKAVLYMLDDYRQQYAELKDNVFAYNSSTKADKRIDVDDFCQITTLFRSIIQKAQNSIKDVQTKPVKVATCSHIPSSNKPIIQKINIKEFSGSIRDFAPFIELYNSVIHNNVQLTDIEKFAYIRSLTKGEANSLVMLYEFTEANYAKCYQTLVDRYSNPRRVAAFFIQQLLRYRGAADVVQFLEIHRASTSALVNLKQNLADFILFEITYSNCKAKWRKSFDAEFKGKGLPTLGELMSHLEGLARNIELQLDMNRLGESKPDKIKRVESGNCRSRILVSHNGIHKVPKFYRKICFHCKGEHPIYFCEIFKKLNIKERLKSIRAANHCTNCLGKHLIGNCLSHSRCRVCSERHHSSLHEHVSEISHSNQPPNGTDSQLSQNLNIDYNSNNSPSLACSNKSNCTQSLLGTVSAYFKNAFGEWHMARGILDPCSENNYVSSKLCQTLGLRKTWDNNCPVGIGEVEAHSLGKVEIEFQSLDKLYRNSCSASVLKSICNDLPSHSLPDNIVEKFRRFPLADQLFWKKGSVDFLLGVQVYADVICAGPNDVVVDKPMALRTALGWVVLGKIPSIHSDSSTSLLIQNNSLEEILDKFWSVEEVPNHPKPYSAEEEMCIQTFNRYTCQDSLEGRYSVPLLVRPGTDSPVLYNRNTAIANYKQLELRLSRNPTLSNEYRKFMQDFLDLGHMRFKYPYEAPSSYLLPQHCVIKESSSTTRTRVVFNASHKGVGNLSLNDILMAGPKCQPDLIEIMLQFRLPRIALCADIQMLYRQIKIRSEDTRYQHTLLRLNSDDPIQEVVHERIVYGLKSSSFLAQATLNDLANKNQTEYPRAAKVILKSTYMDDICTGAESVADTILLRKELTQLLSLGCFPLRKWSSSHNEVLEEVLNDYKEKPLFLDSGGPVFKILVVLWQPNSDCFTYKAQQFKKLPTKRALVSFLSSIYDPLGFLQPCIFYAKCIIQKLWILKLDWDDLIPLDIFQQWQAFLDQLVELEKVQIPRWLRTGLSRLRLVGFCDGSILGYAACVYCVVEQSSDKNISQLVISKSRLAPIKKPVTIPRMELLGAHLLAELVKYVIKSVATFEKIPIYLYSDSSIVLAWLTYSPHLLQTFVANRIVKIKDALSGLRTEWRYVPGSLNAADCCSRGLLPKQILTFDSWWAGPTFLQGAFVDWPRFVGLSIGELPETKRTVLVNSVVKPEENYILTIIEKHSSLLKLQRVISWCLRFINNSRKNSIRCYGPLNNSELQLSLLACVRVSQNADGLTTGSPRLSRLSPFLEEGVLRVGGRLKFSVIPYTAKHPIILSKSCHLAQLLCDHYHRLLLHAGPRTVQANLQRKFWILHAHSFIRHRIRQCITCRRFEGQPQPPFMADLPAARVTPTERAFLRVATDFAGPFEIRSSTLRKGITQKGYACVFVCLYSKAVHIEAVSELSTPAFINTLHRFVARRGMPSDIWSDHGRNYIGANRCLKEWSLLMHDNCDKLGAEASLSTINWHFSPPYAPNFNGLAEAAVKSAKWLLIRQMQNHTLTFEGFSTLLARIEAVLNSRPIGVISSHPADGTDFLSPGHLLIGQPLTAPPELTIPEDGTTCNKWAKIQQLAQSFWRRWSQEYIHTQIQRGKWLRLTTPPVEGQLVFVKDANGPALSWPVGVIKTLIKSSDGIVRSCVVRTKGGLYTRAVNKLILIPNTN